MEASISSSIIAFPMNNLSRGKVTDYSKYGVNLICSNRGNHLNRSRQLVSRIRAINEVSAAADPARAVITWQIVVGAIAGVTPFVVAGIEFGKRIIAQRQCEVCGGSGLVLRDKDYFRCPGCGGFLPWRSWKRFFSG